LKRLIVCLVIIVVFLINLPSGLAQSNEPTISLYHSWGGEGNVLNQPLDLRVTNEGHILVVNRQLNRITKIVPGEENFYNFDGFGSGIGQVENINGITTDSNGTIYVGGKYIYIFSNEGEYLRSIYSVDVETGNADEIMDVAVDAEGNIHVIAYGQSDIGTIKSFTPDGLLINQWNPQIGSENQLLRPHSIEMTPDNNLIISDFGDNYGLNGRVIICDTQGNFLKEIRQLNENHGVLSKPVDTAINPKNGHFFVSDAGKHRIYEFSADAEFIQRWDRYGEPEGVLFNPWSIEFDSEGNLLIVSLEQNVRLFAPDGEYLRSYGITAEVPGQFKTPYDILISETGVVYVADRNQNRIQTFETNGTFLREWKLGVRGADSISGDSHGNIYVTLTDKLCKYDSTGGSQWCWGEAGTDPGKFNYLSNVVVQTVSLGSDVKEWVYTSENLKRIQIFETNGGYVKGFEIEDFFTDFSVDSSGMIFGLNWGGDKIYKYNIDGDKIDETALLGFEARSIGFGPDGFIYLTDRQINRIHRMDPIDLTITKSWMTENGEINTKFLGSAGFDFSKDGLLYLTDFFNARVLVFKLNDNEEIQSSDFSVLKNNNTNSVEDLIQNGGFENELNTAIWTFTGPLPFERSDQAHSGNYSLQLGKDEHNGQAYSQAYTTIAIPEDYFFPNLTFYYQVSSKDSLDLADLYVEIQDGVGLNHLTKIVHSGSEGLNDDSVWREASVSLSAYRGETIRLSFQARNRTNASTGVLVRIDDVQIISKAEEVFLPLINR